MKPINVCLLIVLIEVIVIGVGIVLLTLRKNRNEKVGNTSHYRHDISVFDALDITSGRRVRDNNRQLSAMDYSVFDTLSLSTLTSKMIMSRTQNNIISLICSADGRIISQKFHNEVIIGRTLPQGKQSKLIITNDNTVSKNHCRICEIGGEYYIEDLGSSNRTYLNYIPINALTHIVNGDSVIIGKHEYNAYINREDTKNVYFS